MQLFLPNNVSEEKVNFLQMLGAKLEVLFILFTYLFFIYIFFLLLLVLFWVSILII